MNVKLGFEPEVMQTETDRVIVETPKGIFRITEDNQGIRVSVVHGTLVVVPNSTFITIVDEPLSGSR